MTDAKPETPLTDERTVFIREFPQLSTKGEYVAADFARALERENAALRRALQDIRDGKDNPGAIITKALNAAGQTPDSASVGTETYTDTTSDPVARACLAAISGTEG